MNEEIVKINDQYYILASSAVAEQKAIALKSDDSFAVIDRYGNITSLGESAHGLYFQGTRFLSKMELKVNNETPFILSSFLNEENEMQTVNLTNTGTSAYGTEGDIDKGTIHIQRQKFLWKDVCYETIQFRNYGSQPTTLRMSFSMESDFKDIFEVRGMKRERRGDLQPVQYNDKEVLFIYNGLDNIKRTTRIKFTHQPVFLGDKRADFEIYLNPNEIVYLDISIAFQLNDQHVEVLPTLEARGRMIERMDTLKGYATSVITSDSQFNEWLKRSKSDLYTMITELETGFYPYAGIPWYSTPFGRDGIITALESLWITPAISKGVLKYLAQTQSTELNDLADAEPGKIFHERREGEMANTGEIPFKMYYGTVDATPLFICLAGAYFDRTGDVETIREIWPNIERALEWIDKYGDSNGDGFIDYSRKQANGLGNQGWKDSWDAIFHEDGTLAQAPIALCEVQGYVYLAKIKASQLATLFGDLHKAEQLKQQAEELKERFARDFWIEEKQTFAIALDGNKRQCRVSSSNAGQCLLSGIVKQEHAEKLAKTLLSKKMFSGWGIRTMATDEALYNPMSYHNGSIWPHDNALIALGLARYGFHEEVHEILAGIYEVTKNVDSYRLPELFCGFEKVRNEGIVHYPVACSPQAWAVGCSFLLIQACLGLKIIARENAVYFYKPTLPDFMNEATITNLRINDSVLTLQARRIGTKVEINILASTGPEIRLEVIHVFPSPERPTVLDLEYSY
jgi:glycogen debranching enzyme